jgi:predicted amidohydrolase
MPALRMAIAQPAMYWTTEQNAARIDATLVIAASQGAQLCLFPELALTGFHRGIREQAQPDIVARALRRVRTASRERHIACALGAPTFNADGTILNSYLLIDAEGEIVNETAKDGLTPAEATFFTRGTTRPVAQFEGRACATVICREVEDLDAIDAQLADHRLDLVFWPGLVGPKPDSDDPEAFGTEVRAMARRLGATVVQSNWPHALNTPESTGLGESRVIDANGDVHVRLPRDEPGVGVFTLGERALHWTPLPA